MVPGRADDVVQGRSLDVGHGEVFQVAVLPARVDGHDVRVVQPGEDLLLPEKPLAGAGGEMAAVAPDRLHRHAALERLLHGLVDRSHPAAGDLADDPEVAQSPVELRPAISHRLAHHQDLAGPGQRRNSPALEG